MSLQAGRTGTKRYWFRGICMGLVQIPLYLLRAAGVLLQVACAAGKPVQDLRRVLQITVDGLRGDLPGRYQAGFGKDGFSYLLRQGTASSGFFGP